MKNRSLAVLLILCMFTSAILSAGCTGSRSAALADEGAKPDRTLPAGVTAVPTMDPATKAKLEDLAVTAQDLAAAWDLQSAVYEGSSVTVALVNTNGDTVTIRSTLYTTPDEAYEAYTAAKEQAGARIVPLTIPDESYGAIRSPAAEVGFVKSTVVTLTEYVAADGKVTMADVTEIAKIAAGKGAV
jgi:predicted component of type VI protein secretion system